MEEGQVGSPGIDISVEDVVYLRVCLAVSLQGWIQAAEVIEGVGIVLVDSDVRPGLGVALG